MSGVPQIYLGSVLSGDKDLIDKLINLQPKVFKRGLVQASRKAMKPVVTQAKANARNESGALEESIGVRVKIYQRSGTVATIVGPRQGFARSYEGRMRNPFYYGHLQELGHKVVKGGSLMTRWSKKVGNNIRAKGTGHTLGFVAGMPFLRPALESNQTSIVSTMKTSLSRFVEREAKKANK